jgi:hypothetical protein
MALDFILGVEISSLNLNSNKCEIKICIERVFCRSFKFITSLCTLLLFVIPLKISKFETNEDVLCCVATNGDS